MELRRLRYFVAVGTVRLLDRNTRAVKLTHPGKVFLEDVRLKEFKV